MRFIISIMLLFLPKYIYKFVSKITNMIGKLMGNIYYYARQQFPNKKTKLNIYPISIPDEGNYDVREFEMWDNTGNLVYPTDDEVLGKYISGNNNYPTIGSERYNKAGQLDINYFFSDDYEYDYIVLGDRAQIEEVRKGNYLTSIEESLIVLGYGYDGKPFGQPWGIEERCLNDYIFAEKHGEFLTWGIEEGYYEQYVLDGYTPPYQYDSNINNSIQLLAYRRLENYLKAGFKSINKDNVAKFKNNKEESVLRKKYQGQNLENHQHNILNLSKK